MYYDVVTLEDKLVVGITDRTNNTAPDVGDKISQLWQRFYTKTVLTQIHHRIDDTALGIYTDYTSDEKGDYTVMTAYEVSEASDDQDLLETKVIKGGKYAKFVIKDQQEQVFSKVAEAWQVIWQMDLPRLFAADFEAYQLDSKGICEVHIYISLKE